MRKYFSELKRMLICMLTAMLLTVSMSGCAYSSFDEYLQALGIKDSYDDEVLAEADSAENAAADADDTLDVAEDNTAESAEQDEESEVENNADISDILNALDESESGADSGNEAASFAGTSVKAGKQYGTDDFDDMQAARLEIGLDDDGIGSLKKQQQGLYAYERLTEEGKTLYVELLAIMQNEAEDIIVSTTSDEAVELVFDYVMADHPEIFYVDGYQYTNYTIDGAITRISFSGNYIYNEAEVAERQRQINEYVNECIAGAPSSSDDYYVIKYVYEYLIENTDYDVNAVDNQNICSVFIGKKSVCNGYAKATQYILNKLGIKCTLVTGTVNTKTARGVRHAWNLVQCNNAYYYLDTTWGDASYQTTSGENADATKLPSVNYDYLNVTTADISGNHTISDVIHMPVCNSMADNYYVREDEYFTSPELALVGDLFRRRYRDGSDNVTIKCSSSDVYDKLFEQLITDRKVFDYLEEQTSVVSYTTFAETKTIIFWL